MISPLNPMKSHQNLLFFHKIPSFQIEGNLSVTIGIDTNNGHLYNIPIISSMDWFNGKSTGNHRYSHSKWFFSCKFSLKPIQ